MAWNKRGRRQYYYHNRRTEGRPQKVYLGRGERAEFAALQVEEQQAKRVAERQVQVAEETVAKLIKNFNDSVEQIARAVLILNGFYQHDRGAWRKRRERYRTTL